MPVCVIKNTEPKNISIPTTAIAGGVAGLALRKIMPAKQEEIDTFLFNQYNSIKRDSANNAIKGFMKDIKQQLRKNPTNESLDLFVRSREAQCKEEALSVKQKIKTAPKNIQLEISEIKSALAQKIKAARHLSQANIVNATKQARTIGAYLFPGIGLGALAAYVYNVVGTITRD